MTEKTQKPMIEGYARPDGQMGIRNRVAIIYTVDCARFVSEEIARRIPDGVAVGWFSCYTMANNEDASVLIGIGRNPNIGAALVIGLGCETASPSRIADGVARTGKKVEVMTIQGSGGTKRTIRKGVEIGKRFAMEIGRIKRTRHDLSGLTVGVKCGGSDATSALTANPATGLAADLIIDNGGRILSSELTELAGCEHLVRRRARDSELGERAAYLIRAAVTEFDARFGREHTMMSTGNVNGGLTTIEEKSMGALMKTGHRQLQGILQPGEYPTSSGWYIVDGLVAKDIRHFGAEADGEPTDFAAAGAQLTIFTTGRGSANGNAVSPLIKVCANPQTYRTMRDDMDFNAGAILEGKDDLEHAGNRLFRQVLRVASGKQSRSELLGHREGGIIFGGRPLEANPVCFSP